MCGHMGFLSGVQCRKTVLLWTPLSNRGPKLDWLLHNPGILHSWLLMLCMVGPVTVMPGLFCIPKRSGSYRTQALHRDWNHNIFGQVLRFYLQTTHCRRGCWCQSRCVMCIRLLCLCRNSVLGATFSIDELGSLFRGGVAFVWLGRAAVL